jgi:S-adenosylmethionine:tRNA ribosyltransferase-isomerase
MEVSFPGGIAASVSSRDGVWYIEFERDADQFVEHNGLMPLPPYIMRQPTDSDRTSYQTVYARKEGAIAAPTAGLHFTQRTLEEIGRMGVETAFVTLHIGPGTFKPVRSEEIELHRMHAEMREVPRTTAYLVNAAKKEGRRVVAVGTTVVRALESSLNSRGEVVPQKGTTDLFIYPGYEFKVVDALLTNFHLPRSTLLMLVCAFGGKEMVLDAYKHAVREGYRFLSYGDAMLII